MAIIISKKIKFKAPLITSDVISFNVYFCKEAEGPITAATTKVNIPYISGQELYTVDIPGANIPITEGVYIIGVAALDAYGNEGDIEQVSYPFDFTAPPKIRDLEIV